MSEIDTDSTGRMAEWCKALSTSFIGLLLIAIIVWRVTQVKSSSLEADNSLLLSHGVSVRLSHACCHFQEDPNVR
jgi:hypothetical protein